MIWIWISLNYFYWSHRDQPVHVTLPLGFFFKYQPNPQLINGENRLHQIKQGVCSSKVRKWVKREDFLSFSVRLYLILWRYKIQNTRTSVKTSISLHSIPIKHPPETNSKKSHRSRNNEAATALMLETKRSLRTVRWLPVPNKHRSWAQTNYILYPRTKSSQQVRFR